MARPIPPGSSDAWRKMGESSNEFGETIPGCLVANAGYLGTLTTSLYTWFVPMAAASTTVAVPVTGLVFITGCGVTALLTGIVDRTWKRWIYKEQIRN